MDTRGYESESSIHRNHSHRFDLGARTEQDFATSTTFFGSSDESLDPLADTQ